MLILSTNAYPAIMTSSFDGEIKENGGQWCCATPTSLRSYIKKVAAMTIRHALYIYKNIMIECRAVQQFAGAHGHQQHTHHTYYTSTRERILFTNLNEQTLFLFSTYHWPLRALPSTHTIATDETVTGHFKCIYIHTVHYTHTIYIYSIFSSNKY